MLFVFTGGSCVFLVSSGNLEKEELNPEDPVNPVNKNKTYNRIHSTMEHEELTHKIIGCAYKVFNTLGFGFLESIYRKSYVIELTKSNLKVEEEMPLQVFYDDVVVGNFSVDLYVENRIVVELKSVQNMVKDHEVQLVNYLNGLKKEIGLLINFGPSGVQVKRKYREKEWIPIINNL